ncbi:MAG: hypothetical protein AB7O52_20000 [Planctomycetota bacterium]
MSKLFLGDSLVLRVAGGISRMGSSVASTVRFDNTGTGLVQAWSFGVCHDESRLDLLAAAETPFVSTINGGANPGFFTTEIHPGGAIQGVIIDYFGGNTLPPGLGYEFVYLLYAPIPNPFPATTLLFLCDTLGPVPVDIVIVILGQDHPPTLFDGTVAIEPPGIFRRGDCNDDSTVNLADIIASIGLVTGSFPFQAHCDAACDANDDRAIDISDAIYLATYIFLAGPAPPVPFPECGVHSDGVVDCAFLSCS